MTAPITHGMPTECSLRDETDIQSEITKTEKDMTDNEMTSTKITNAYIICTETEMADIEFGYFCLFIVATSCPSERRPRKTVSCYGE